MTNNEKWVWEQEEDLGPQTLPLLDQKLTPIVEWAAVESQSPAENSSPPVETESPPAPASPVEYGSRKAIPASVVKAIVLHLEGKVEEAILELQAGLRNGEPPVELYAAMGALQMELERFEDAATSYRELLARDPDNKAGEHNLAICADRLEEAKKAPKSSPALVKAIVLHMEKRFDEAIKELRRGIKSGEQSVDVYSALGHLHFEVGSFDLAAEAYEEVLKREPLHNTCHYNLAVCQEKLGRHKEALNSFQKAFEINPKRAEMGIGAGVSLLHLRRFAEAVTAFENCLRTHPEDVTALFGRAFALQCASRLDEAEAGYLEVLKRDPAQEEALVNLLAISAGQGKDAGVRSYAGKLLAIRPESRAALEALLAADLAGGNYKAAYANGERLTRAAADSFEAWLNYGVACHGAGRIEEAAAAFLKATRIRPKSPEAFSSLGRTLQEKGDLAGAEAAYESGLKISPNHPAMLWNLVLIAEQNGGAGKHPISKSPHSDAVTFRLGLMRFERGDYPGSVEAFRTCLQTKPDWPEAQLNLGLALWKSGNLGDARKSLEAVGAPPFSSDALHHLAIMAVDREDYDAALRCYERLATSGERSPELFFNTGLILQNLGRGDEAANQFREALALNPSLAEASQRLAYISKIGPKAEKSRSNGRKDLTPAPQLAKNR